MAGLVWRWRRPTPRSKLPRADKIEVKCVSEPEIESRLEAALGRVCEACQLPGARVNVLERPVAARGTW